LAKKYLGNCLWSTFMQPATNPYEAPKTVSAVNVPVAGGNNWVGSLGAIVSWASIAVFFGCVQYTFALEGGRGPVSAAERRVTVLLTGLVQNTALMIGATGAIIAIIWGGWKARLAAFGPLLVYVALGYFVLQFFFE
jgi:hypothetical protein